MINLKLILHRYLWILPPPTFILPLEREDQGGADADELNEARKKRKGEMR